MSARARSLNSENRHTCNDLHGPLTLSLSGSLVHIRQMNEITAMLLYEKQKPVFYFFGDVCESSRPPAVADVTLESLLLLLFLLLLASSWNTERTNNNNNNEK